MIFSNIAIIGASYICCVYIFPCKCIFSYIYIYIYICMHLYIYTSVYKHIYIYIFKYIHYAYVFIFSANMYKYTYAYIYVHMYICTYYFVPNIQKIILQKKLSCAQHTKSCNKKRFISTLNSGVRTSATTSFSQ